MTTTVEQFRVLDAAGKPRTAFESNPEVVGICRFSDGTKAHTTGHVEGGAVLVMLDVDGEGYAIVHADSPGATPDLVTVEAAIVQLETVRDELRRLA